MTLDLWFQRSSLHPEKEIMVVAAAFQSTGQEFGIAYLHDSDQETENIGYNQKHVGHSKTHQ